MGMLVQVNASLQIFALRMFSCYTPPGVASWGFSLQGRGLFSEENVSRNRSYPSPLLVNKNGGTSPSPPPPQKKKLNSYAAIVSHTSQENEKYFSAIQLE